LTKNSETDARDSRVQRKQKPKVWRNGKGRFKSCTDYYVLKILYSAAY